MEVNQSAQAEQSPSGNLATTVDIIASPAVALPCWRSASQVLSASCLCLTFCPSAKQLISIPLTRCATNRRRMPAHKN